MTKTRFMLTATLMGCVAVLGGCKSFGLTACLKAPGPEETEDHAPLRTPVGLDAPDTRSALAIPPPPGPVPPLNVRCIEDPPKIVELADPGQTEKQQKKAARKERLKQRQEQRAPGPRG
jgi:hypothetical protein